MFFSIQTNVIICILAIIPIAITLWLKKAFFWSLRGRHVVITGDSSDIGLWIAIRCVKLGAHVTLLGQNTKKLKIVQEKIQLFCDHDQQRVQIRPIDFSKDYSEVSDQLEILEHDIAPIYWLVNCAGDEINGDHTDHVSNKAIYSMNFRYYAVYYPTRYALTQMKVIHVMKNCFKSD